MNPAFLYVVALLLALIEQFRAKGQSLLTWGRDAHRAGLGLGLYRGATAVTEFAIRLRYWWATRVGDQSVVLIVHTGWLH